MDSISTTVKLSYTSKPHTVSSRTSGSFSLSIRGVERTLVRSPTGRESLANQKFIAERKVAPIDIPYIFLASEEICRGYLAMVLTKAKFTCPLIQQCIVSNISRDAVSTSRRLGEKGERGFLLEVDVEIAKERWLDNWLSPEDYDSQGRLIPMEQDCTICLEELTLDGQKKIMKLCCSHNFHTECIRTWLHRNHSCPTCRNDVQNPRPGTEVKHSIMLFAEEVNNSK